MVGVHSGVCVVCVGSGQSVKVRVEGAWTVCVLGSLGHAPLL